MLEMSPPPKLNKKYTEDQVLEEERERLGGGPYAALCLSGGGMRSASFCLGFLRGFASLLEDFHYLSTVSGGGYAGAWVTHLARTKGWPAARTILLNAKPSPQLVHLRRYSDLLEANAWVSIAALTLASAYLMSLVVWWMLYLPLAAVLVSVPLLLVSAEAWLKADPWGGPVGALLLLVAGAVSIGIAYRCASPKPEDGPTPTTPDDDSAGDIWPTLFVFSALFAAFLAAVIPDVSSTWMPIPKIESLYVVFVLVVLGLALWRIGQLLRDSDNPPASVTVGAAVAGSLALVAMGWASRMVLANPMFDHARFPLGVVLFAVVVWFGVVVFVGVMGDHLTDSARHGLSDLMGPLVAWSAIFGVLGGLAVYARGIVHSITGAIQSALTRPGANEPQVDDSHLVAATALLGLATAYFSYRSQVGNRAPTGWRRYFSQIVSVVVVALGVIAWTLLAHSWTFAIDRVVSWLPTPAFVGAHLEPVLMAVLAAVLGGWCVIWARCIRLNTFSLNGLYRLRLVRAFLRQPETLTVRPGFSEKDDPVLDKDWQRPLHLINVSLNDAHRLEWRERRATSFVLSPLFCGSEATQYRRTSAYAGGKLTVGRAIAISGAAANPNMGYFATKPVTWLLGLLNLRLGWWLGNPDHPKAWRTPNPRNVVRPLLQELRAQPDASWKLLNLSDGGHFENLGLYQAIRRKCRCIVAVDASYDPDRKCEDLARAERLIRIDMGAQLEWHKFEGAGHYRIASIKYAGTDAQTGTLVYVKPELTGNEPADVLAYARHSADRGATFPHESTSDLWFGEAQFESYMALGHHSATTLLADIAKATEGKASVAGINALTVPLDDLVNEASSGGEIYGLPPVAPPPPSGLPEPWWAPLLKPVGASVAATAAVLVVAQGLPGRDGANAPGGIIRNTAFVADRGTNVMTSRERTVLLPWFDEGRPSEGDMKTLMTELNREKDKPVPNTIYAGAAPVLHPWDIAQLKEVRDVLLQSCNVPIDIRGLSSSSQSGDECGGTECKNTDLADRRAELVELLLKRPKLVNDAEKPLSDDEAKRFTKRPWRDGEKDLMVLLRFNDKVPESMPISVTTGSRTRGYLRDWGTANRSVELVPMGFPCDTDHVQSRTRSIIVDRVY